MIIKFYFFKLDNKKARLIIEDDLNIALSDSTYTIDYVKEYWKIDGAFEAKITASINDLKRIKEYFATEWIEIGNPIEEYLTSNTMEDSGIKNGYLMINIIL